MTTIALPGLDCGICGYRTCDEFASAVRERPELMERCINRDKSPARALPTRPASPKSRSLPVLPSEPEPDWQDSLGREFDFYLEHFPEEPGPRETIIPHNPMITRELNIQPGDLLVGRPLGMSCGCPITHCGIVMDVDQRTGVINWCVTGPLRVREHSFKDLGYYIAEAYDGLVRTSRVAPKIGMRYYFQPRMCMLQWRHSGLVNFMNRTTDGIQIRLEGLWIG